MSWEERQSWIYLVVVTLAYLGYLAIIVGRARDTPIAEVAYAWPMLGAMFASIVALIVGAIGAAIASPRDVDQRDERDERIAQRADVLGIPVLSAGLFGALALTLAEAEHFWIGNAIYLSFVVTALVSTVIKLIHYRRGF